ncbi:unnamed protein product, partial [Medioppia subpectinata]
RGGFGEVYQVKHIIEGKVYAVKIVKLLDSYDDSKRQDILKEVQHLVKLKPEYVVKYRNSWIEGNHLYIQMDCYPQNLQTIIDNKSIVFKREPEEPMKVYEYFTCCEIFRELLKSVQYLHDSCPPVIHRDLKPENVLIAQNSNNNRFIRLSDFGSATFHDMTMTSMSHTCNVGTAQYMAPEVYKSLFLNCKLNNDCVSTDDSLRNKSRDRLNIPLDINSNAAVMTTINDNCGAEWVDNQSVRDVAKPIGNINQLSASIENMAQNEGTEGKVSVGEEGNTHQERQTPETRHEMAITEMTDNAIVVANYEAINYNVDMNSIKLFHVFDDKKGYNVLFATNDDMVYGMGSNYYGSLGLGHNRAVNTPHIIPELCQQNIQQFICGKDFVLFINDQNCIHGWGRNDRAQLARPLSEDCGYYHSLVVTGDDCVYGWGNNNEGKKGYATWYLGIIATPMKIQFTEKWGRGGFGEVYHVKHMIEGEEYAVKIVKFLDIYGDHKRQEILKEVQNLVKLRSDFVVNYRNSWREDNHLYIQMDYYPQNLQTIIDNKHKVFERQTGKPVKVYEYFISCEIFRELLESVKYLHDSCPPVIHRDLKPSNVLISQNNNNNRFLKLCDFGSATFHDMTMTSMSHTSNVGTSQYMAPEVNQSRYSITADIYSLGMIAFHLFDLFNISSDYNPMEIYNPTLYSIGRPVVGYSTITTTVENMGRNEGTEGKGSVGEEGNTPQERHKREERNQSHVSIGVTSGHKSRDIESDKTDQLSTRVMSGSAAGGDKHTVSKGNASKLRAKFESMAQKEEIVVKRRADEERDRRLEREKHEMKAEEERQQVVTKAAVNLESDAENQRPDFGKTAKPSNNSGLPTGLTATALYNYKAVDTNQININCIQLFHVFEDEKGFNVLLVTNDDMVYGMGSNQWGTLGWGRNYRAQLARSPTDDYLKPVVISLPKNPVIRDISCGDYHSLVVTGDDCVYGWGSNLFGQTGCEKQHSTEWESFGFDSLPLSLHYIYVSIGSNQMSNFFSNNFEKLQTIGRGGFGEVYHVRHKIEQEIYAVKMVKFDVTNDNCKRQKILKEVQNLKTLRSEFMVNYHNSWLEDNHLFIQMDYYPQNLQSIIDNKHIVFGRQPEEPMKVYEYFISCEIFKELLECVQYLHDSCPPVIHRDLKPSNFTQFMFTQIIIFKDISKGYLGI